MGGGWLSGATELAAVAGYAIDSGPSRDHTQPRAGRIDLVLQEPESKRRYEVEKQLGATNVVHTHIARRLLLRFLLGRMIGLTVPAFGGHLGYRGVGSPEFQMPG